MHINPGAGRPAIRPMLVENMVNAFLVQFGRHDMTAQEGASVAISVFLNVVDAVADTSLPTARKLAQEMRTRLNPLCDVVTVEELRRHTRKPEQPESSIVIPPGVKL